MGDHTYKITLDENNKLVRLVVQGVLNKIEGEGIILETRAKAAESQYDILCDISEASINATTADWFFLVRDKEIYPTYPTEKTAILINPETIKVYKFFETVTRNVGFKIRIFYHEEDAMKWIKKGE